MDNLPMPGKIETVTEDIDLDGFQSKYIGFYETDLGICSGDNPRDMIVKANVNLYIKDNPKRIIAVCKADIHSRGAHGFYDFTQPVLDIDGFLLFKISFNNRSVAGNTNGGKEEARIRSFDTKIIDKWWNLADRLAYGSGCWYPN